MKTKFSELIETTPAESLLVGTLTTIDRDGLTSTSACIEGTPTGFRMLAKFLLSMADSVESGKAKDKGWGLCLSPEDVPAICTRDVRSLSLLCKPKTKFSVPKPSS